MFERNTAEAKKFFLQGLLLGGYAKVVLDPRMEGVLLPLELCQRTHLNVNYGEDLTVPTTELVLTNEGISSLMSFLEVGSVHTFVPWASIFLMAGDNAHASWPEAMPDEFIDTLEVEEDPLLLAQAMGQGVGVNPRRPRPAWLTLVD